MNSSAIGRQDDGRRRSLAGFACDRHLAAHAPREVARDRQAESDPRELPCRATVGLEERLEHALQFFLPDADAGVAHPDAHPLSIAIGAEGDTAAIVGVLRRVREQARENLLETPRVGPDSEPWPDELALEDEMLALEVWLDQCLDAVERVRDRDVRARHSDATLLGVDESQYLVDHR